MEHPVKLRLFVAMEVPEHLKGRLGEAIEATASQGAGMKWVRPENVHFTLKFLGGVEEEKLGEIESELAAAAQGHAALEISTGNFGAFPHPGRARVFWLGIEKGREELTAMASSVDARMANLGFEPESRPFSGHITLARLRRPRDITPLLSVWRDYAGIRGVEWRGEEMVLYRSELYRTGPVYAALARFKLEG